MNDVTGELSAESLPFKDITWKIPNFLAVSTAEGRYVDSPSFLFANAVWRLRLRPNGDREHDSLGHVDLLIERLHTTVTEHRIQYKIGLKTRRGKQYESWTDEEIFAENEENVLGVTRYIKRSKLNAERHVLLPNGTLTVFCEMRLKEQRLEAFDRPQQRQGGSLHTELHEAASQTELPESATQAAAMEGSTSVQKLQSDFKKLLQSEEDSDVCLKISDKEFRAHKCILRARSTVFSAMFKHETEEKASGEVVIDDLNPDAFPDFLEHVYAGRVESLTSKKVPSLYFAADKYDLQELKSDCREYMKRTLSVDTFCDVMTLALRHQEEELLRLAIDFFSKNLTKIIVTAKWQTFSKDHNTEANELLIKALVPGETND